jgi:isopentenyldiphosphate isomerase
VHGNNKLIHRSIGVAVVNDRTEIFLQRRSFSKDTDGGFWTLSCSGHVGSGETYEEAARKELHEELGVEAEIKKVATYIYKVEYETEIVTLFTACHNGPFSLHKDEIIDGRFFSKKELEKVEKTGVIKLSKAGRQSLQKLGWI